MTIAIFGATSAIAREVATEFANQGYDLILMGRDRSELNRLSEDLTIRHQVNISLRDFDATSYKKHKKLVDSLPELLGAFLAFGYLGRQAKAQTEWDEGAHILETNFLGACSLMTHLANRFEEQKSGWIATITSVAGDRGRKSNYYYGAAKGGLSLFLQGVRHRLAKSGVRVIDFKLGCVDTPMIKDVDDVMFVTSPTKVAKSICQRVGSAKSEVYLPWFWRGIMHVIRSIPERLFLKMEI